MKDQLDVTCYIISHLMYLTEASACKTNTT